MGQVLGGFVWFLSIFSNRKSSVFQYVRKTLLPKKKKKKLLWNYSQSYKAAFPFKMKFLEENTDLEKIIACGRQYFPSPGQAASQISAVCINTKQEQKLVRAARLQLSSARQHSLHGLCFKL